LHREKICEEVVARVDLIEPPYDVGRNEWNIARTLANSGGSFQAFTSFAAAMAQGATLPRRTREVAILRVGTLCGSEYEWRRHVLRARRVGLTDDQIGGLRKGLTDGLSEQEQMAVRLAEAVEQRSVDDGLWKDASAVFNQSELVELTLLAAMYSLVSRFLLALDVDLDADISGPDFP
jgi:alkylhydroperoxidase family enzyme